MAGKVTCENCRAAYEAALPYYEDPPKRGLTARLRLTGNTKGAKREFVCLDCGHIDWTSSKSKLLKKG
jgi:transcription elongation factor Elf1